MGSFFIAFAQPPCTNETEPPGETACLATPICNFDGYCGRTLSSYTADAWPELADAICEATETWIDCMTIENDSYLKFIASSSTISFNIYVYDCNGLGTKAIQVAFFTAANCSGGAVEVVYAESEISQQVAPHVITVNGLVPGQVYYILIDGYSNKNCGYTFEAIDGVASPGVTIDFDDSPLCTGESIVVTATGGEGNYEWSGDNGLGSTSGASVTITPPSSAGTYNYSVESIGGNDFCPDNSTANFSLTMENCNDCVPPEVTTTDISMCPGETVSLSEAINANPSNGAITFYSSEIDAQNGQNAIDNNVSISGTYYVRAEDPLNNECFSVFSISVTESDSESPQFTNLDPIL